jgi:hypothetical protein
MFRPSVGGPLLFLYFPNGRSLADTRQWARRAVAERGWSGWVRAGGSQAGMAPPKAMPTPSRSSSTLGSSPGIGA